jgi:heparan-alpha-glucosaminide N-acetyltransferase
MYPLSIGCKPPFDPENLLGAIPTIFLAYLGIQAGRILGLYFFSAYQHTYLTCSLLCYFSLVMYQSDLDRLIRLFAWSIFTTAIGVGLTAGTLDGGPMPLNKNLWTISFSFFTGSYFLIDVISIMSVF